MATTPNLGIPLLEGTDVLARQRFNEALQHIDTAALPVDHVGSKAHWPMWKPNKEYFLVNVVRTETCPEWGYLECTQPGISGSVVPADLFGEGDTSVDGDVIWTLRRIGGGTKHGDLTGRTLPDQHPIGAITGLREELDARASAEDVYTKDEANALFNEKADRSELHVHDNKDILDKFAEDNGRPTYNGAAISGTSTWSAGKLFVADDLVVFGGQLYRCRDEHTATDFMADLAHWESLNVGNIPNWQAGKSFNIYDVVCQGNNVLRCLVPHTSSTFETEKNNWEIIAGKGATLADWQPNTDFALGEAVVVNDVIYRCTTAHTSSAVFSSDMIPGLEKWKAINGAGGAGVLRQVTKLNVVAPQIYDIVINYTSTFNLPPVEFLKFIPGQQDQVYTACSFDNADADDFTVDGASAETVPYFTWDGTMRPRTSYIVAVSDPVDLEDGSMAETDWIDTADYIAVVAINI